MWRSLLASCEAALPYVVANAIPIVNFVVLLVVIIGLQKIWSELAIRTRRFEHIERVVDQLQNGLDANRASRVEKVERDVATLQIEHDVATLRERPPDG